MNAVIENIQQQNESAIFTVENIYVLENYGFRTWRMYNANQVQLAWGFDYAELNEAGKMCLLAGFSLLKIKSIFCQASHRIIERWNEFLVYRYTNDHFYFRLGSEGEKALFLDYFFNSTIISEGKFKKINSALQERNINFVRTIQNTGLYRITGKIHHPDPDFSKITWV